VVRAFLAPSVHYVRAVKPEHYVSAAIRACEDAGLVSCADRMRDADEWTLLTECAQAAARACDVMREARVRGLDDVRIRARAAWIACLRAVSELDRDAARGRA